MSFPEKLYGAAVVVRNRLYDRGTLAIHHLAGPVVSVGNISSGGTGKTPFVILLGELLKQRGIPFDVLSRGYGRTTKGVLLVDPNGAASVFGDEPLLIAQRLGCPVIVGESRHEAGLFAEKKYGAQLHILDDGFQHRSLARDFDIVMLTPEDVRDHLLPTGRLREPLESLHRADALVVSEGFDPSALPISGKTIWRIHRDIQITSNAARPAVFCGIARPQQFLEQLRSKGIVPVVTKTYRDHHAYSRLDIEELTHMKAQFQAENFITTEKDALNLGDRLASIGDVAIARVTMKLIEPANALDTLLQTIRDRKPLA